MTAGIFKWITLLAEEWINRSSLFKYRMASSSTSEEFFMKRIAKTLELLSEDKHKKNIIRLKFHNLQNNSLGDTERVVFLTFESSEDAP